jgi:L-threonylcarbamoyladenylate synthase
VSARSFRSRLFSNRSEFSILWLINLAKKITPNRCIKLATTMISRIRQPWSKNQPLVATYSVSKSIVVVYQTGCCWHVGPYLLLSLGMKIFDSFTTEVVQMLQSGAVGVVPTDTVYGIVCSLFNQSAVERIYEIKDRDKTKPIGTILLSGSEQIELYAKPEELLRAEVFWPGPVSVVLDLGVQFSYAHRGKESLPFRVPDSAALQSLVEKTGPLASTSANIAGQPPAVILQEALGVFRESVDFYVDGGDLSGRVSSKIIKFNGSEVEVIRENT